MKELLQPIALVSIAIMAMVSPLAAQPLQLEVLASFAGTNGREPEASLTLGSDGNFYSTTHFGGSFDDGTVFRVTTNGVLTTLVSFFGTNGAYLYASLAL